MFFKCYCQVIAVSCSMISTARPQYLWCDGLGFGPGSSAAPKASQGPGHCRVRDAEAPAEARREGLRRWWCIATPCDTLKRVWHSDCVYWCLSVVCCAYVVMRICGTLLYVYINNYIYYIYIILYKYSLRISILQCLLYGISFMIWRYIDLWYLGVQTPFLPPTGCSVTW